MILFKDIPVKNETEHKHLGIILDSKLSSSAHIKSAIFKQGRELDCSGFSKLNLHKFKRNFRETVTPMCPLNDAIEDTVHTLMLCPSFDLQRRDILTGTVESLRSFVQITNLSNDAFTQLLLYGDQYHYYDLNRSILELTLRLIHEPGRFG